MAHGLDIRGLSDPGSSSLAMQGANKDVSMATNKPATIESRRGNGLGRESLPPPDPKKAKVDAGAGPPLELALHNESLSMGTYSPTAPTPDMAASPAGIGMPIPPPPYAQRSDTAVDLTTEQGGDIRSLICGELQAELANFTTTLITSASPGIIDLVGKTMGKTISQVEGQIRTVDSKVGVVDAKVEALRRQQEANHKEMQDSLQAFQKTILEKCQRSSSPNVPGSTSGCPPTPFSSPAPSGGLSGDGAGIAFGGRSGGFYRIPDKTVLFANSKLRVKVSSMLFGQAILQLARDVNLCADDFKVIGNELDDRFDIQFLGDNAERSAHSFYDSLSLGRGIWKEQSVAGPDPEGGKVQFYISPDKNPAQVRKEVLSRKLQTYIQSLLPEETIFVKKTEGVLRARKRKVVTVCLVDEVECRLDWEVPFASVLRLDMAVINDHFKNIIASEGRPSS